MHTSILKISLALWLIAAAWPSVALGASWTIQTTPEPSKGTKRLDGISCPTATACEAVGSFELGGSWADGWNGTSWTAQTVALPEKGEPALVAVSCTAANECTGAGGNNGLQLAERWNGTSWTVQKTVKPEGETISFKDVSCPSSTACTAVGEYENKLGLPVTLAERWNGTSWTKQTTVNSKEKEGETHLLSVSCPTVSSCVAGGYENGLTFFKSLAETWNGTSWAMTTSPPGENVLASMSCTASNACTATVAGEREFVLRWNGTGWTEQKLMKPENSVGVAASDVSCSSATSCTVVGKYSKEIEKGVFEPKLLAEEWDGTTWTVQSVPVPSEISSVRLMGVSCKSSTECMAVGFSFSKTSVEHTLIERFN